MPDEGFRKWLGVEYEVMEEGHAVVSLNVTDDMRNLRQVVQGGVIAALIDVAMATAAAGGNYDTRRRPMATLEMKVNYLAAATGDRLTAVADVIEAPTMNAIVTLANMEVIVDLDGLIDIAAERIRLEKEREKLTRSIGGKEGKLSNSKFVDNAPADIVQRERESLDKLKSQLESVSNALQSLPQE